MSLLFGNKHACSYYFLSWYWDRIDTVWLMFVPLIVLIALDVQDPVNVTTYFSSTVIFTCFIITLKMIACSFFIHNFFKGKNLLVIFIFKQTVIIRSNCLKKRNKFRKVNCSSLLQVKSYFWHEKTFVLAIDSPSCNLPQFLRFWNYSKTLTRSEQNVQISAVSKHSRIMVIECVELIHGLLPIFGVLKRVTIRREILQIKKNWKNIQNRYK